MNSYALLDLYVIIKEVIENITIIKTWDLFKKKKEKKLLRAKVARHIAGGL